MKNHLIQVITVAPGLKVGDVSHNAEQIISIIQSHEEAGLIVFPELSGEEVRDAAKKFFRRFFTQQFKRSCLPDGPKVGSVTLSPRGDWRMSSDASVELWLKDLA